MGILGRRKNKKKKKRPSSAEQRSRNAEYRRKQYLSEAFIQMMNESPELRRQIVAQEFNLKLPEAEVEQQNELRALIYQLTMNRLNDNPELAEKIVKANVRNLMIEQGWAPDKEDAEHYASTPLERALAIMDAYDALRERFGGGKGSGFWDFLKDKDLIVALVSIAKSMLGAKSQDTSESIVVTKVDGTVREITESEYKRLKTEGRTQPLTSSDLPALGHKEEEDDDINSESDEQDNINGPSTP